jgi:hypothetical protein
VRTEKLIKCINLPQHKIKHSEPILKLVKNAISIELELTPSLYCVVLKYEFKIKYAHNYMLAYTKSGFFLFYKYEKLFYLLRFDKSLLYM